MRSQRLFVLLGTAVAAAVIYARYVRPWQLTWGATSDEVLRSLPGDELVSRPTFNATRAITVAAPPDEVWPWLVQVGLTRAGWYSYDILDNLGHPSARRIIPELQDLAPGDVVPMSPDGKQGMKVYSIDPPRSMIWGTPGDTTWVWQLDANHDGSTRLVTRVRSRYRWLSPSIAFSALLEFGDIWMMRKMLLNLRIRAESGLASNAASTQVRQSRYRSGVGPRRTPTWTANRRPPRQPGAPVAGVHSRCRGSWGQLR